MRFMGRLAFVVVGLLSLGCSVTLSGRAALFQRESPTAAEQAAQIQSDQRLLEVFGGNAAKAEAALVALGFEPREAARRVLAALQAAQAGRTPREDGR